MSGFAAPAPAWLDPEDRRLRRWVAVSLGLHVALALAGVIWGYVKPLPPPVETPVTVEFTSPVPPQQAQGERPAPAPSPTSPSASPSPSPLPGAGRFDPGPSGSRPPFSSLMSAPAATSNYKDIDIDIDINIDR
jgi:hypothetical protein